jgi:hypothetical protein
MAKIQTGLLGDVDETDLGEPMIRRSDNEMQKEQDWPEVPTPHYGTAILFGPVRF